MTKRLVELTVTETYTVKVVVEGTEDENVHITKRKAEKQIEGAHFNELQRLNSDHEVTAEGVTDIPATFSIAHRILLTFGYSIDELLEYSQEEAEEQLKESLI